MFGDSEQEFSRSTFRNSYWRFDLAIYLPNQGERQTCVERPRGHTILLSQSSVLLHENVIWLLGRHTVTLLLLLLLLLRVPARSLIVVADVFVVVDVFKVVSMLISALPGTAHRRTLSPLLAIMTRRARQEQAGQAAKSKEECEEEDTHANALE